MNSTCWALLTSKLYMRSPVICATGSSARASATVTCTPVCTVTAAKPKCSAVNRRTHASSTPRRAIADHAWSSSSPPSVSMSMRRSSTPTSVTSPSRSALYT
ncbi:hypothetical protein OV079_30980 [Nannocystis pusilla]|uniref:Secreted protein n=1 Tax=Nannocystis pusilla TaxID=889268 RepID=A0A9X3EUZ7_9BACT|nr:hypothetical protein [Nannocystis pusilla]MCY1009909.1 hypothetical protein [Nannocystis pusilla]